MSEKTLFEKIIDREIPADIVYEDNYCIAINDINPQAPIHILLIPKKPIQKLSDCTNEDKNLLAHLFLKIGDITKKLNINDAFRININNGEKAGQEVFHLHIHILSGRKFNWPPG
ncbi:MAG: histidine triad nucleotide-binding protein [Gammaproteobacteria bacterium]|jgi:histidine triad (HIT) family protein